MPDIKELLQSMTNRLILINVLVFFGIQQGLFANAYTGFELYYFESSRFRPWQLITHLFLHGGPVHLASNMIALWFFGHMLERYWGETRFVIFYLICGVGAALISFFLDYLVFGAYLGASLGASGAIYGLMVAFARTYPNFEMNFILVPIPILAKYFVSSLLLMELAAGITGFSIFTDNVGHFAHLGGALVGFLMVQLFKRVR